MNVCLFPLKATAGFVALILGERSLLSDPGSGSKFGLSPLRRFSSQLQNAEDELIFLATRPVFSVEKDSLSCDEKKADDNRAEVEVLSSLSAGGQI